MCTDMNSDETQPGDLIEVFRGTYKHWALYIGSGFVVHFVTHGLASSGSPVPIPADKGTVLKQKLLDVVGNDKWRINNSLDKKYKVRQVDVIVKEACLLVGAILPYSLTQSNCEHFVNELRYGKAESRQVNQMRDTAVAGGTMAIVMGAAAMLASALSPSKQ